MTSLTTLALVAAMAVGQNDLASVQLGMWSTTCGVAMVTP